MTLFSVAVIALFAICFGLVSERLRDTIVTPPMIFVSFGLLAAGTLIDLDVENEAIHLLAELTLILVLFTDASRIDLRLLIRDHDVPLRLLSVGLPLTIVAGSVLAWLLFPELGAWGALALGIVLAPTDAALGQAVVTSAGVPVRIRQGLNVESGLNDGIALPVLLFAVAMAETGLTGWLGFLALQLVLGPLVGVLVGYVGGKAVERAVTSGWMSEAFEEISSLGLAVLAFALAELVGGNGFIGAFVAGLTVGNTSRGRCAQLWSFAEAEGQLLVLLTFTVLGVVIAWPALQRVDADIVLYAFLSLTLVRIVPVALSTSFMGLRWETILFIGWFGPRGVASLLYVLIVLGSDIPGRELILTITAIAVLASVFAHGLSAAPGARWFGRRMGRFPEPLPEHRVVEEMPFRR